MKSLTRQWRWAGRAAQRPGPAASNGADASRHLLDGSRPIHFVGIGGIGMSGLARICHERGLRVSGCDAKLGSSQRALQQSGIAVCVGHHAAHITPDIGLVVYSQAVDQQEPELLRSRELGLPTICRGELLAQLAATKRLVAIAGAHGKTTTSGMAAQLLVQAEWDPTFVVGGYALSLGTNARSGRGRFMVAETDESDGSFLFLHPSVAVVTNLDREHLNHYGNLENLVGAFRQFVKQIGPNGVFIRCEDDRLARDVLHHPHVLRYGLTPRADVTAESVNCYEWGSEFSATYLGQRLGTFRIQLMGRHNVQNALAIVSIGLVLDIPMAVVRDALWEFQGTSRRFQRVALPDDICFVDDYAHHPSEIQATLSADISTDRRRIVVFQPHRFSRVKLLEEEFSRSFNRADGLIVTDVYSAFEAPIPHVSGERLADLIRAQGLPWVRYVPRTQLRSFLRPFVQPHDTVFFLGAGDISELCHELANELRTTSGAAL